MNVRQFQSFTAALRELARVAPAELDSALVKVGEEVIVPASKERANAAFSGEGPHDGTSSRLAERTRVVKAPKGIAVVNDKVYANVQNWGGRTWHARSRVGRSSMPVGGSIKGSHFISDAARDNPAFDAAVLRAFEELVDKHLK